MSDSPVAVVLLTHNDADHVNLLLKALAPMPIILHVDRKSPETFLRQLIDPSADQVILAPRIDTRLASWSLVQAELVGLRLALERTRSGHIVVMSGADIPLTSVDELIESLRPWAGQTWMVNRPLPWPNWSVPGFKDGGLWRMQLPFLTRNDQIVWAFGKPVFFPRRRRIPHDLNPTASSHWKIYSRDHAERLLSFLSNRPDLIAFARHTFTPEESFIQSVMTSRVAFGADAVAPTGNDPWYIPWPEKPSQHPEWISEKHLPEIAALLQLPAATPCQVYAAESSQNLVRPLFARKISVTRNPALVNEILALRS